MSARNMAFLVGMLDVLMGDDSSSPPSSDTDESVDRDRGRASLENLRRRDIHQPAESDSDADIQLPMNLSIREMCLNKIVPSSDSSSSSVDHHARHLSDPLTSTESTDLSHDEVPSAVPSLLELTSQLAGRSCTCEMLEYSNPPLDEALLRKVAFCAFPTDETKVKAYASLTDHFRAWSRGETLLKDGKVREMWQVGFMATAYIVKYSQEESSSSNDIRVSLTFEQQRILSSTCSDCKTDIWCAHVVAAVLYRMHNSDKVRVHAPMTETLSTLDRTQLQKVLQYAIQEDPAGILGKVFKHIDSVRDTGSQMNTMTGIPDPTFGGLELANSHWQMSLDILKKSLQKSLSSLTSAHAFHNMNKYYPDSYDQRKKQKAYMNWYNHRVVELIRNQEYRDATEVLICIMNSVVDVLKDTNPISRDGLRRYFHDMCRFYALVMVYVQDKDGNAWQRLRTTAEELNSKVFLSAFRLKQSKWAEMPPLASCFPGLEDSAVMYEPMAACRIAAAPPSFYNLIDDQTMASTSDSYQPEAVPVMFARLEALEKFDRNLTNNPQRIVNLTLCLLDELAKQAKKYSIVGEYLSKCLGRDDFLLTKIDPTSCGGSPAFEFSSPDIYQSKKRSSFSHPGNDPAGTSSSLNTATFYTNQGTNTSTTCNKHRRIMRVGRGRGGFAPSRPQVTHPAADLSTSSDSQELSVVTREKPLRNMENPPEQKSALQSSGPSMVSAASSDSSSAQPKKRTGKKLDDNAAQLFSPMKTRAKRRAAETPTSSPQSKKMKGSSTSGKGKRGSGPSKGKLTAKRRCMKDGDQGYTAGQLTYGITYCCYTICKAEKKTGASLCADQLLLGYTLLAIEMGYFRTSAPETQIVTAEHDWLYFLEQQLTTYLQKNITSRSRALHIYMEAFKKVDLAFYEGVHPLVLLDSLGSRIVLNSDMKRKWSSQVIDILAALLKSMPSNLKLYTMPTTNRYSYYYNDMYSNKQSHKDFVPYKIHTLTSTFLSLVQPENSYHEDLIIEVLQSFKQLDSIYVLNYLIRDFRLQLCGLQYSKKLLHVLVEFVLHAYKSCHTVSLPTDSVLRDQRFLQSLCSKLGLSCIKLVAQDWKTLFNVKDMRDLIYLFEMDIRELSEPPEEVVSLIMEVLRNSYNCTEEVCDLLAFFKVGDASHKLAIRKILENKSSYSPSVLFTIVKQIWSTKKVKPTKNQECDAMKLLEAAVSQIRKRGAPTDEQLDWLCEVATEGTCRDVSKNQTFQMIVSLLARHGIENPAVLVRFLQNMEKVGPQWMKHVVAITEVLIRAYSEFFSSQLYGCSHSSYSSMINKMLRARLDCVKYVADGGAKFDDEVVDHLRILHRTKKKFIRMLDVEFSSLAEKKS